MKWDIQKMIIVQNDPSTPKESRTCCFLAIVIKHPLFLPLYFTCNYYKIPWCYQVPMYLCTSILITKVETPLDNMFEDAIVRKKKIFIARIHLASIGVWFYLSKIKKNNILLNLIKYYFRYNEIKQI